MQEKRKTKKHKHRKKIVIYKEEKETKRETR